VNPAHSSPPPPALAITRKVVVVYDDPPAGERAARKLARIKTASAPDTELVPTTWSFASLAALPAQTLALNEVDAAGLLILSINQLDQMPPTINRWLRTCLGRRRQPPIQVLALLDDDIAWSLALADAIAATPPATAGASRSGKIHPFPFTPLSQSPAQACA